jgi:hypothetical protein
VTVTVNQIKRYIIKMIATLFSLQFLLAVVGPVTVGALNLTLVLMFLVLVVLVFSTGMFAINGSPGYRPLPTARLTPVPLGIISIGCSLYAANFYTGSIWEGYVNLLLGVSNYNDYQAYFNDQGLGALTLSKVPAILASAYVKFFFFFSLYYAVLVRPSRSAYAGVFLGVLAVVHFSVSRGTSYEFFEILLYTAFVYLINIVLRGRRLNLLNVVRLSALAGLMLLVYKVNIDLRYQGTGGFTPECDSSLCFDPSATVVTMFPGTSILLLKLNGYFTFGFVYLAAFLSYLAELRPAAFLIPLPFLDNSYAPRFLCENGMLRCGVQWSPSAEWHIMHFSLIGMLLWLLLLGCLSGVLVGMLRRAMSFEVLLAIYFNLLIVFSLPTGYFFSTSSANVLIYGMIVVVIMLRLGGGVHVAKAHGA